MHFFSKKKHENNDDPLVGTSEGQLQIAILDEAEDKEQEEVLLDDATGEI